MTETRDPKPRLMEAAIKLIWGQSYGSTSVDAICDIAGVKKGSFYYHFQSKSDLAVAAIESKWQSRKPVRDAAFSPVNPPLERFRLFFADALRRQEELQSECGYVLGCPIFSLGCEVCTQDEAIRAKVEEILEQSVKYFESAIRDAHAEGSIHAPDAAFTAKILFAYFQGVLTQARIRNSLDVLRELPDGALALLGAPRREALAA
jgi:TetR/AcrR family transcriptional repressor of nem operon